VKRGGPLKRKTEMNRGKGFSKPFPGTVRVSTQTRSAGTHDDGVIHMDLRDTPETREVISRIAAIDARRAMENRQRSLEAGSPAYQPPVAPPKRQPKGDGSFSKATKDLIVMRDEGRCAGCGVMGQMNFQHRQARAMGGTSDAAVSAVTNGMLLCGSGTTGCHGWAESHPELAEDHGWSVPQWADPASMPVLVANLGWVRLNADGTRTLLADAPPQHCATMVATRKEDA